MLDVPLTIRPSPASPAGYLLGSARHGCSLRQLMPGAVEAIAQAHRAPIEPAGLAGDEPTDAMRVLLVDDCDFQQLLSCSLLAHFNIFPTIAHTGDEAVRFATTQRFDLILMDIEMPGMDGVAATLLIRQAEWAARSNTHRPVPILAYTTAGEHLPAHAWLEFGFNALLKKPCGLAEFARTLRKWCGHLFALPANRESANACLAH